jgi:hypothetical protein
VSNSDSQGSQEKARWRRAPELPQEVFAVLRKPNRAINPCTIVATVDADGTPHAAPFGSVRAVTPRLLRMISARYHDTYANLCRDGRTTVALVAPPDIAVSIRGRARVVRERMNVDEHSAVLEIDVAEVKNDMVRTGVIESGITFSPRDEIRDWFEAAIGEAEDME